MTDATPTRTAPLGTAPQQDAPQRIAKILARAGLCSRRDAERWIAAGRVALNGTVLTSPAVVVGDSDEVRVDGKPLPEQERARLWRYHKPAGLVTTHRDEKDRPTVFAALPKELPRLISIGRLDLNSEGLLLLTNDGGLARRLELPATGWLRRYRVRVHGLVEPARLAALAKGVTVDGIALRPDPRPARPAARLQRLADAEPARGQEPRGAPRAGASRLPGDTADPLVFRPVPARLISHRGAIEEVPRKVLDEQLGSAGGPAKPHARRRR